MAAKLLWFVFPRLGEQCMADVMQVPSNFRDADWIEFEGREDYPNFNEVILIPEQVSGERWHLRPNDVIQIDAGGMKHIFLRKGGEVTEIKRVPGSDASPSTPGLITRMGQQCGAGGSRCSNHIEICCVSNEIIGGCYGRWSCPEASIPRDRTVARGVPPLTLWFQSTGEEPNEAAANLRPGCPLAERSNLTRPIWPSAVLTARLKRPLVAANNVLQRLVARS